MTQNEFVDLVHQMRLRQKEYFSLPYGLRKNEVLGLSKELEKKVDKAIEDFKVPNLFGQ
jgi:ATP sulfurylase